MNKTEIKAEIVAHSLSQQGDELISVLCTFPRIILAEVNTHRMLSKNTSSSRAIPFNKMVEAVQNNPFIPIAWQKEHKGMQGSEYVTNQEVINFRNHLWLEARDYAIQQACVLNSDIKISKSKQEIKNDIFERPNDFEGVTKQLCNRLLEPFMWTTMLITGSKEGWENFFNLRCPQYIQQGKTYKSKKEAIQKSHSKLKDKRGLPETNLDWLRVNKGQAEIHMMALAEAIYDAVNESTPKQLKVGEWHIPFEKQINFIIQNYILNPNNPDNLGISINSAKVKISTAMAAHTSYTTVGNEPVKSYEKWIELHDKLIAYDPPHSSPMEHCARAMSDAEYYSFTKGKIYYPREGNISVPYGVSGWCNNLKGFIPYRYFIDNKIEL